MMSVANTKSPSCTGVGQQGPNGTCTLLVATLSGTLATWVSSDGPEGLKLSEQWSCPEGDPLVAAAVRPDDVVALTGSGILHVMQEARGWGGGQTASAVRGATV